MRYRQNREQSSEILRIALAHMGRQQAGFHPASYALWYEYAAGINPPLSQVLEARIAANNSLTDADVLRLYSQYIVTRDGEAIERIQQRLLILLQDTSQIVASTGSHAVHFGEALEDHSLRLKQPVSMELIQSIVSELLTETQQMCAANATLSRQLDTSSQEVLNLTHRLERMQAEALIDPLTGLLNRRGFERAVAELNARPGELEGASLLAADVDHFKGINDSHGHLVGDQVLRAVAQVLRARTAAPAIAARLGGDEFVALLPKTSLAVAVTLAEQIRSTLLEGRLRLTDREQYVENITLSVGVAEAGAEDRLEDLLHRADAALYAAKRAGRNQVSVGSSTDTRA
jgi:diguanylate cyclase